MQTQSLPPAGLTRAETRLAIVALGFVALALLAPPISQPQAYHQFADARELARIPRALDVLSNMGFFLAGVWGLRELSARKASLGAASLCALEIFFWGALATAFGSAFYHWAPTDARLVWDRLPMALAFAGACGALAAERTSPRAGFWALGSSLAFGLWSVWLWSATGNLAPYCAMQFGAMAWIACAWLWGSRPELALPWGALLGFYVAAKACEALDSQIFALTHQCLSGHTAKHVLSACACASFAWALRQGRKV